MKAESTSLRDVLLLQPTPGSPTPPAHASADELQRTFMAATGQLVKFADQHTVPCAQNELQGLHYLVPPHVHGTLLRVTKGGVYIVVADIRRISPGFGNWTGHPLSEQNQHMLWVPPGLAIGVLGQAPQSHVAHYTTGPHSAKHMRAIVWDDPELCINWPLTQAPHVSEADRKGKFFSWWSIPKDSTFGVSTFEG